MRPQQVIRQRLRNAVQSVFLLAGMVLLVAVIGGVVGGLYGVLLAAGVTLLALIFGPRVPAEWTLRRLGAVRLSHQQAPQLRAAVDELSRRAELEQTPALYYLPSPIPNALALGSPQRPTLAVSDGLLRGLETPELIGVLAHEIGHIKNRDLSLLALAQVTLALTRQFALFGKLALILAIPLLLTEQADVSLLAVAILIWAPSWAGLLLLALSRTREFNADLAAARLTGDPVGLASALYKLERFERSWFKRLFLGPGPPLPTYLSTHPDNRERIRRLEELQEPPSPRQPIASWEPHSPAVSRWRPMPSLWL